MVEIDGIVEQTPTGFLNEILEKFIKDLVYIKKIQNYFLEI